MEIHSDIVDELRRRARQGEGACALAAFIGNKLGLEGRHGRLYAIAYFQVAFALPLSEAMCIGAAPIFEGQRTAADVDAEMNTILNATSRDWDVE